MHRKYRRANALTIAVTVFACLSATSSGRHCTDPDALAAIGMNPNLVVLFPETYHETLYTSTPSGDEWEEWEVIEELPVSNCTKTPITHTFNVEFQKSESISHTVTGDLRTQVAIGVGLKDISEVGLEHAKLDSNGWQYKDDYSLNFSTNTTATIGPCKGLNFVYKGKVRKGSHSGTGRYDFTMNFRVIFSTSIETVSASCKPTDSHAFGQKRYIKFEEVLTSIRPNCAPGDGCRNCTVTPVGGL